MLVIKSKPRNFCLSKQKLIELMSKHQTPNDLIALFLSTRDKVCWNLFNFVAQFDRRTLNLQESVIFSIGPQIVSQRRQSMQEQSNALRQKQ